MSRAGKRPTHPNICSPMNQYAIQAAAAAALNWGLLSIGINFQNDSKVQMDAYAWIIMN